MGDPRRPFVCARSDDGATVAHAARRSKLRVMPAPQATTAAFASSCAPGVDLLLNVHSLTVIDEEVVAAPASGSFNLHPGPLPGYAGLNVPSWAIFNGERRYGVSLHWMEAGVDAGPLAWSRRFPILKSDTGISLFLRCIRTGLPLIERLLRRVERGRRFRNARRTLAERALRRGAAPGRAAFMVRRVAPHRRLRPGQRLPPVHVPVGTSDDVLAPAASASSRPCRRRERRRAQPGTITAGREGSVLVATNDRWVAVERVQVDGTYHTPAAVLDPGACSTRTDDTIPHGEAALRLDLPRRQPRPTEVKAAQRPRHASCAQPEQRG